MDPLVATAMLVGLLGGVHCAGMCGGIVAGLNLRARTIHPILPAGDGTIRLSAAIGMSEWSRQLAYNGGRITSYAAAGALAGGLGGIGVLMESVLPVQMMMLVVANGIVILMGLYLAGLGTAILSLEVAGAGLWRAGRRLGMRLAPAGTPLAAVGTGLVWGWLPCGLVYSALATALVSGSAGRGALVMLAFGVGTLPNLLAAGFAAQRLRGLMQRPYVRLAAGLAIASLGVAGLVRVPGIAERIRQGLLCLA